MTVAVTGHRDIVIDEKLKAQVEAFFVEMLAKHRQLTLLSALAEGADQFVAECALDYEQISLAVTLPFFQEEYLQTLHSETNFLTLQKKAKDTFVIPTMVEDPYENLGHYLVDNSDVLLALWDGTFNGKKGGTGEVVTYAKSKKHTVIHIPSQRQNN